MIRSDRRKLVTIKGVLQKVGEPVQMLSRVVNKLFCVFGEIHQYLKAMAGQYEILKLVYFSLKIILQDIQLLGEQAVQSMVEMIQIQQENQSVIA